MMKVKCPECEEKFELDINEYDQGDNLDCPECSTELIVYVQKGMLKVKTQKQDYYDSELDEFFEEED